MIDSVVVSEDVPGFGVDFLRIQTCDFQFLVSRVPRGIGPSWSSNIGIEYRRAWGRIPDANEREKIEELCSFVFGRQLLPVGYTIYDKDEHLVEGCALNPWRRARSLCSKPDEPPIRISDSQRGKADGIIGELLPTYFEMREPLRLKEALWNYWISRDMPIGMSLPILVAAIESMRNGWFKQNKSKSQGYFMKKNEFEALLKEEIENIAKKLEEKKYNDKKKEYNDKIVAKIRRANEAGMMDSLRIFFEEIGLSIDGREWEAIEERHRFVHGHFVFGKAEWKQVIQRARTLDTLLHKTLLKLLGYDGTFIDRSVLGWKDKQLS